jgi:GT2 family glycosyltransferase
MLRRDVWRQLGGLDEDFYPIWFEDVDFCKRLRDHGYRIWYQPASVAKHTGAHAIRKISVEIREVYWYRSLLKYASKHFTRVGRVAVCMAVMVGCILRIPIVLTQQRRLKITAVYGRVARLAGQHLFRAWRGEVEVLPRIGD